MEEEKPDLLVLATHGKTGFERLLFGSVAEKVIRLAQCPLLLVPQLQKEPKEQESEQKESALSESQKNPSPLGPMIQKQKEILQEKKKVYQEKIELQLKDWAANIDTLKGKTDKAKTDAQVTYKEQIENLRMK